MKRVLFHIAFWAAYLCQDVSYEFLYINSALPNLNDAQHWILALKTSLCLLVPKLAFAYFIVYVVLPKLLNEENRLVTAILLIAAGLVFSVFFYRVVLIFVVYPGLFGGVLKPAPFFDLGRLLNHIVELGFVSGAAVAVKLLRAQLRGKEKEKNLVKEKLETELKFLRNQTNPHFLFNTLNNIYALARKKSDETPEVVMKLSKILRFMLYESGKGSIPIADEIRLIDDYLELEKIRYNERLSVVFTREIDNYSQQVAPLLLLPFIENAFKHGVSETRFNSFININLRLENGILDFSIENSKEAQPGNVPAGRIGLGNVQRQLELMYSDYKLDVHDAPDTFTVNLTTNLNHYAKI